MTWQEELEAEVTRLLSFNDRRVVPMTRSEAILLWTMVDALGLIPEWVEGEFSADQNAGGPLARCQDVILRVTEGLH